MNALLVAIAGGSTGAILTLLSGIPEAIRNHDRLVAQTDEDLAQWVSDECVQLERELRRHQNEAGRKLDAGSYLTGVAVLKEGALHRYRDQERLAQAKLGEWRNTEGFLHGLLRRFWFFAAFPELDTPINAEPILDGWREEVSRGLVSAPVSDPTKRPLSWAVGKYGTDAKPWDHFLPS
jgi:hypothetical protein